MLNNIWPIHIYLNFELIILKYIIQKGSVAVDGISLTVAQKTVRGFKAAVIPHTWKNTNLQNIKIGARVNLELDQMAKYVESILNDRR